MSDRFEIPIELVDRMRQTTRLVALTGAGVSAESGIPTFRQAQTGLWAQYRAEELATPQAFLRNPRMVWEWYTWRRTLIEKALPNPGHFALARLERILDDFILMTQNVDGLHQRAGSGRHGRLIELHGNITRNKCFDQGHVVDTWLEAGDMPPRCPLCGGLVRPDVVWFGESLPYHALQDAWAAAENCEMFLSVGTSGLVEPAASLPYLAMRSGAIVIEINPDETPLTPQADFVLHGPSGVVLPALLRAVWTDAQPFN